MKAKTLFLCLIVFALATAASAQTKISGTAQCGKPDQEHSIQIGDRPNHSFAISQGKCTWTKPWEIAGIQNKEGLGTTFAEISGNTSRILEYCVQTMANGDKAYLREEGTITLKDGVPQSGDVKWTLVGGTGKLKGVKGKGTCKLREVAADGSITGDCAGEYELPK
jgi:hypothetical protein